MNRYRLVAPGGLFLVALWFLALPDVVSAQGFVTPGVGPVNNSMGGAAVAAPLDAAGAIHWNPATISGLPTSSVDVGAGLINVRHKAYSTVGAVSGDTRSSAGWTPLPAIGAVYKQPESPMTIGLGLNTIGGFFVNFPASTSNPIFMAPPAGFGTVYSRLSILQIAPTAAYQLSKHVSVGVSPTITIADLQANPFGPGPPNKDGSFPEGYNSRLRYGMGVHAGIYVTTESDWNFGFSVKSPQWFEKFHFNSIDSDGTPRKLTINLEYPTILSLGTSYTGFDKWLLAADVRWFNYGSAPFFGDPAGFNAAGGVSGLGWKSVFALALGAQYQLNEMMSVRIGYSWNENPIPESKTFFSLQAPSLQTNSLSLGTTMQLNKSIKMHVAWQHFFSNEIAGPFFAPGVGPVAGTNVRIREAIDFIFTGVTVTF
jgi:long-chain fatty acid transport protein